MRSKRLRRRNIRIHSDNDDDNSSYNNYINGI